VRGEEVQTLIHRHGLQPGHRHLRSGGVTVTLLPMSPV
jgi:hypothetical protein